MLMFDARRAAPGRGGGGVSAEGEPAARRLTHSAYFEICVQHAATGVNLVFLSPRASLVVKIIYFFKRHFAVFYLLIIFCTAYM